MDKEERMDEELQREAGTARPEEGDSLFDPMGNPIETEPPVPVEDEMEEEFPTAWNACASSSSVST